MRHGPSLIELTNLSLILLNCRQQSSNVIFCHLTNVSNAECASIANFSRVDNKSLGLEELVEILE